MPPRYLTWAIVGFWLTMTSWLFYRDLRPRLWPAGQPPFTIDITDEAQSNLTVDWTVYQDGKKKGYCQTSMRHYPDDDTYELHGLYKLWDSGNVRVGIEDQKIESAYRMTRDGDLRAIRAEVTIRQKAPFNLAGIKKFQVEALVQGQVQDQFFQPHGKLKAINLDNPAEHMELPFDLTGVRVPDRGSVLNPLQPLNRLTGLQPGQRWSMPMVDPLAQTLHESAKALLGPQLAQALQGGTSDLAVLQAHVLPTPQLLRWGREGLEEEVPCLVIEYEGEDIKLRTWVRQDNSLILQQEVKNREHELILVRDP